MANNSVIVARVGDYEFGATRGTVGFLSDHIESGLNLGVAIGARKTGEIFAVIHCIPSKSELGCAAPGVILFEFEFGRGFFIAEDPCVVVRLKSGGRAELCHAAFDAAF